ncbi:regulator of chromosome condensation 1/beta-lactamase-inhibitor protein II [Baffinella frigidus]|nr:regulator of chromosome condensation 1/beta-lactamase-inhibitor protein II [Cryptophyta sp. CCMP2293]
MLRSGRVLQARGGVLFRSAASTAARAGGLQRGVRSLWTWGNADFGKHGGGGDAVAEVFAHELLEPTEMQGVGLAPENLHQIVAGGAHTMLVTVTGRLLSCGFGETGQLGRGDLQSESFLDDVEGLGPVAMASCGHWHSAAVTRSGDLNTWGSNKHGQLGVMLPGGEAETAVPIQVAALAGAKVIAVACGARHTLAVDAGGEVYSWGLNHEGQLGHGGRDKLTLPKRIQACRRRLSQKAFLKALRGVKIVAIAAGLETSAAVSDKGALFVWGMGRWHQLATGDNKSREQPVEVLIEGTPVTWTAVSLGDFHVAGVTTFGEMYTWGLSMYGALGLSDNALSVVKTPILAANSM